MAAPRVLWRALQPYLKPLEEKPLIPTKQTNEKDIVNNNETELWKSANEFSYRGYGAPAEC